MAQAAPRGGAVPHADMTEQVLLGAILLEEDQAWSEGVDAIVRPADFFTPEHRATYSMMLALHRRGEAVTVPTVIAEMARQRVIDRVDELTGGAETYLVACVGIDWMFSARGCSAWARQIAEYSARRTAITNATAQASSALDLTQRIGPSVPIYERDEYRGAVV